MKSADAVFFQRPAGREAVNIVNLARVNKRPICVDYDDDLYTVPLANPTFAIYGNKDVQDSITDILAKADVITVSTSVLAAKFTEILKTLGELAERRDPLWILDPKKIHVVPNAYDEELLSPLDARFPRQPNKIIVWRGSATHDGDLAAHQEPFCRVWEKHPTWSINMVGAPFWQFLNAVDALPKHSEKRNTVTRTLDPINYFDFLRVLRPALMIVPLEDNEFNRAKSNITYLEGLHAGAISLAPDFDEWRRPGVINYKDPQDFGEKLDAFLSGKYDHRKMWCDGAAYVNEHLLLSRVNGLRQQIMVDLFERGRRLD
jgi:hypothetical protein